MNGAKEQVTAENLYKSQVEEYKLLKSEILTYTTLQHQIIQVLYSAVGLILVAGLTQKEPLIFLVPFCVIIPAYFIHSNITEGFCKIGGYLSIFHEGFGFEWETNLHKFNIKKSKKMPRRANHYILPFFLLAFISLVLFVFYFDWLHILQLRNIIRMVFALCCLSAMIIIGIEQKDHDKLKGRYISQWEEIKNETKQ